MPRYPQLANLCIRIQALVLWLLINILNQTRQKGAGSFLVSIQDSGVSKTSQTGKKNQGELVIGPTEESIQDSQIFSP